MDTLYFVLSYNGSITRVSKQVAWGHDSIESGKILGISMLF